MITYVMPVVVAGNKLFTGLPEQLKTLQIEPIVKPIGLDPAALVIVRHSSECDDDFQTHGFSIMPQALWNDIADILNKWEGECRYYLGDHFCKFANGAAVVKAYTVKPILPQDAVGITRALTDGKVSWGNNVFTAVLESIALDCIIRHLDDTERLVEDALDRFFTFSDSWKTTTKNGL